MYLQPILLKGLIDNCCTVIAPIITPRDATTGDARLGEHERHQGASRLAVA